jgi:hypothetical protein
VESWDFNCLYSAASSSITRQDSTLTEARHHPLGIGLPSVAGLAAATKVATSSLRHRGDSRVSRQGANITLRMLRSPLAVRIDFSDITLCL